TMKQQEHSLLEQHAEESRVSAGLTFLTLTTASLLSAAFLALAYFLVRREAVERERTAEELRQQREWLQVTLYGIGDGVIATDAQGRVNLLNPVAQVLTGWRQEDAVGRHVAEVFHILNEQTRQPAPNPIDRVLREGVVVGLANHTVLRARDGTERPIDDS